MNDERKVRNLVRDQRGAIMVVGAFMAFFLAGALFYLIGTGNAIIYRERVQDASDAIAYSAAGVHARGMNLIVLINLIMAALLAVLIALRMIALMLGIAIIACKIAIAASFGFGAAFCGPFLGWAIPIEWKVINASNKYANILDKVLPVLSKLEVVVAVTTPYVALAKSFGVAKQYKNSAGGSDSAVTSGFMVSPSMVPFIPDGKKLGLPVQEMEYDKFCKKSAELATEWMFFWMPGFAQKALKWAAGSIVGTFPSFFCGSSGSKSDLNKSLGNDLKGAVQDICDKKKEEYDKNKSDGDDDFDMKKCKTDTQKQMDNQVNMTTGLATNNIDPKSKTPKEIWGEAKIGGMWFQCWGVAFGNEEWPRKYDKGLTVASSGGMPKPNTSWGNFRFAQAEFYWDKSGKWSDNKEDAMWEMRWRARLRRVAITGFDLGELFAKFGLSKLMDKLKIGDKVSEALNKTGVLQHIMGKFAFDKAEDWVKGAVGKLGAQLDKKVQQKLQFTTWEIIH